MAASERYTSSSRSSRLPAKREKPSRMKRHLASAVSPGARLVVAMAPAFTIGLVSPSAVRSTAITELKGSPVLLTPSFSRAASSPIAWQTRANMKGLETLWMVNGWSLSPTSKSSPRVPATQMP